VTWLTAVIAGGSACSLKELQNSQRIKWGEAPDGSRGVDGLGDLAFGGEHEPGGVQETTFAFDERSGELVELLSIGAVEYRKRLDPQPIYQGLGGVAVID